jgi:polysaccharide export outer membrane protein
VLGCAFAPAALAQDATYRLQIEDVLRIQIYNERDVDAQVQVGQDGTITPPFLLPIKALGRTIEELVAELTESYVQRLRLRDPKISVTIIRFRELRALAVGLVNRPGSFPIRHGDTVVTLLGLAGGLVQERADPYRATLRRARSQEQIPIDLYALLYRGDTSQNYYIEDGDELLVPEETRNRISIVGAIQRPGPFPFREGMKLSDAIAMGGGEIPNRTMFSRTWVFRAEPGQPDRYRVLESNMVRFFNNRDFAQDLLLKPGDIVLFNKTKTPLASEVGSFVNTAWIFNTVMKQGLFGISPF